MHTSPSCRRARPVRRAPALQEGPVEPEVVGGEHGAVDAAGHLVDHGVERRSALQVAPRDAVDVGGAEADQPPEAGLHVGDPPVEHGAVGPGQHHGDLQDAVLAGRESRWSRHRPRRTWPRPTPSTRPGSVPLLLPARSSPYAGGVSRFGLTPSVAIPSSVRSPAASGSASPSALIHWQARVRTTVRGRGARRGRASRRSSPCPPSSRPTAPSRTARGREAAASWLRSALHRPLGARAHAADPVEGPLHPVVELVVRHHVADEPGRAAPPPRPLVGGEEQEPGPGEADRRRPGGRP